MFLCVAVTYDVFAHAALDDPGVCIFSPSGTFSSVESSCYVGLGFTPRSGQQGMCLGMIVEGGGGVWVCRLGSRVCRSRT